MRLLPCVTTGFINRRFIHLKDALQYACTVSVRVHNRRRGTSFAATTGTVRVGGRHGQGNSLLGLERLNPTFSPERRRRNSPSRKGTVGGRDALDICSDLLATSSVRTPRNAGAGNSSTYQAGKAPRHPGETRGTAEIARWIGGGGFRNRRPTKRRSAWRSRFEADWPNGHGKLQLTS
jgi:hypothetical protein